MQFMTREVWRQMAGLALIVAGMLAFLRTRQALFLIASVAGLVLLVMRARTR